MPLIPAGLASLWAVGVAARSVQPYFGDHPSSSTIWAARGFIAIASGTWTVASLLQTRAAAAHRIASVALVAVVDVVSSGALAS